jgi:hypothetical protein
MNDIETRAHKMADIYEREYVARPAAAEEAS